MNGGSLNREDVRGWDELIGSLGHGWEHTMSPITNLLEGFTEDDFKLLNKADRQIGIFDELMKG